MFCRECGTMISEEVKHCSECGCPVGKSLRNNNAHSEVKKINVCMAIIVAVAFIVMMLTLIGVIPSIKDFDIDNAKLKENIENNELEVKNATDEEIAKENSILNLTEYSEVINVEGPGFASPEESIKGYIEALNKGDIDELISTYAIESYVDNFDTRAHIERMSAFTPTAPFDMDYELSDGSDFDRDIRIKVRQASIIRNYYSMISQQTIHHDMQTIGPLEGKEIDDFMNKISEEDFLNAWKNMKFIKIISPEEICSQYYSEQNQKNIELQTKPYCCEDVKDVCALVEIGGEEYYQFLECGKYNGKWYIISCKGILSSMLGVPSDLYGLVPCSYIEG